MEQKEQTLNTIITALNFLSIPDEQLKLYLKVIDAPDSLEGIIEVSKRFLTLYENLKSVSKLEAIDEFITDEELEQCRNTAKSIVNNIQNITKSFPSASTELLNKKPYYGLFNANPVYVCLGVSFVDGSKSQRHQLLEAYIVYAAFILQSRKENYTVKSDSKLYKSALDRACRYARKLNLQPKSDSLRNLPEKIPAVKNDYLIGIAHGGELLSPLFGLLDIALNGKRARTYNKVRVKILFQKIHHTINDCVDQELIGRADNVEIIQPVAQKANKLLDATESTGGFEFLVITEQPDEPTSGQPSDQHHRRKRAYLQGLSMHNQRLPHRWEMLGFHEVSVFLEAVQQLAEGIFPYEKFDANVQLEIAAVGVTLLLCSLPLDSLETIILNDADYSQISPPGYRYYHNGKTGCWIVRPPKLTMDMKLGPQFYASAERKREFFYISSGTGLENIVDKYIASVRAKQSEKMTLFLHGPDYYRRKIEKILSLLNHKYKTHLLLTRISAFIHDRLAHETGGDLTTAMLLTGKIDFLGISPLHYTAYPVSKLQKMYRDSWSTLMHDHLQETRLRTGTETPPYGATSYSIAWHGTAGSAYRPRRQAVKRVVSRLQERMSFTMMMPRSLDKLIRIHNNVMRYTAILFAFSTGFRAVNSPLLPPAQIDTTTGFAVISDKDGIDYYNSRIVWLPPVCVEQYSLYIEHLEHLLPKLEFLDITAFNNLHDLLHFPLPSERLPLFFFLRRDGQSTVIKPTDVWANIRSNLKYELPENASRHYLRSYLLEQGCDPEFIAAYMGHWERGQEPWGRYSALSPIQYAEKLEHYLVPLLKDDGWKPVPGMQEYW